MNAIIVSHIFPNKLHPLYGVFIKERAKHIARKINIKIVAPVAYFPLSNLINKTYLIDRFEIIDNLCILHPRYFVIPKFFKRFDSFFYYSSLNSFMTKFISHNSVDIFDFQWGYPDGCAGVIWAKKFQKKIILTVRGNESICFFENSPRKKIMMRSLKFIDHIITVSNDLKEKIIRSYYIPDKKVTVIRNGVDSSVYCTMNKDEAKRRCGLEVTNRYVLSLARLSPEKGILYLLEAFSQIKSLNIVLLIVGDGPQLSQLKKRCEALGISRKVRFVGSIPHEDTPLWYNAADVYCLPSLWEGCPNTVIEAMACGIPVVSTSVGGIADLVSSGAGYLVAPQNAVALAEALRLALERRWDYNYISELGQNNNWLSVADKTIDVYNKVLS